MVAITINGKVYNTNLFRVGEGVALVRGYPDDVVLQLNPYPHLAVVAVTHDPKLDDAALTEALKSPAFYIGALGSRANNDKRRKRLADFDLSAAEIARLEMAAEGERLRVLRDRLNAGLHKNLDELYINGSMEHRLPHNLNISFAYVEGESLLMGINDVAVSSGSACTSASLEPSYVLKALGAGDDLAHSSIRFGLGRWTTEEEVDYVVDKLTKVVRRLREMSPLYEMVKEGIDLSKMQWVAH